MRKSDFCSVILVHIGRAYPVHIADCIQQIRLFNSEDECPVYVVSNEVHRDRIQKDLGRTPAAWSFIAAEGLEVSEEHASFRMRATVDRKGLTYFGDFTTGRHFYLHAAMQLRRLTNVFHFEDDNLLYLNLRSKLPVFQHHYDVGSTFHCDYHCIPGLMYDRAPDSIGALCRYLAANQQLTRTNDMALVAFRREHPDRIQPLPVIPPEFAEKHTSRNSIGKTTPDPPGYSSHFDEFQGDRKSVV